jgi:hypothetical protein
MFEGALWFGRVEMQQDANTARQSRWHSHLGGPKQWDIGPAEPPRGARGVVGIEIG